jgi:hypothetical protein
VSEGSFNNQLYYSKVSDLVDGGLGGPLLTNALNVPIFFMMSCGMQEAGIQTEPASALFSLTLCFLLFISLV